MNNSHIVHFRWISLKNKRDKHQIIHLGMIYLVRNKYCSREKSLENNPLQQMFYPLLNKETQVEIILHWKDNKWTIAKLRVIRGI